MSEPQSESLRLPVPHATVETVSAILDSPAEDPGRSAILFAHGAGAPMDSEFMTEVAARLVALGFPVMRFNYIYVELAQRLGKRRPPDRKERLLETHRIALQAFRDRIGDRRMILAGKSMGGRMSSYLAAEGDDCAGLAFFGYPLHPPGKPEKLRSEHFGAIAQPALFLQGTKDPLCKLDLLATELQTFGGKATVEEIDSGNHDFKVPKATGRTREEVLSSLGDLVDSWERSSFPS